jgi:arginase
MTRDVDLIQVPYHAGDDRHGSSLGPRRLIEAGAADRLHISGRAVTVERVDRGAPFRDTASSAAATNRRLAATVARAVAADLLPVVLSGSCNSCMGVLAGFDHSRCGAVWIDAHADFNTPESAVSGFFPGMSLAVVTGHCYRSLWAQVGDSTPVSEEATVLIGVRDLSPDAERERLERSAIRTVPPGGDVDAALDELAARVDDVYVHLDLDALDPEVAPGIVDDPVPGGLSLEQLEHALRAVRERFRVAAIAVTTYNPQRDRDDRTLHAAVRAVEGLRQ